MTNVTNGKTNPTQQQEKYILEVFKKEHNNTLLRIAQITGYSVNVVRRVVEREFSDVKAKKFTFEESKWNDAAIVKKYIYEDKKRKLDFGMADFDYYVRAVNIFSMKNPMKKRTDRGWIATILQFMNTDIGSGRFKKLERPQVRTNHQNF